MQINFGKIKDGSRIEKQIEIKDGLVFVRMKKRKLR